MALDIHDAEWHAQRQRGIGASDVPAIAGLSSWAKPIDIYQQKVGLVEPQPESPLTRWGNLLEPVVAEEAERVLGRKFRRLSRAVHYHDWPILFAHLDRTSADAILEVKTSMTTQGWGESGTSDIPDAVALQVQAQLACADKETAFVAALLGYRDFRTYEIPRDRSLFEDAVLPLLREFWRQVETQTAPEPDGSDSFGTYLRRRHPADDGTERAATPEEQLVAGDLVSVRAARIAAEIREKTLIQKLQDAMGEAARLDGPGWHVTWKRSKDRVTTDWKAVASSFSKALDEIREIHPEVVDLVLSNRAGTTAIDEIVSLYTEAKPGARPFLFAVSGGDTDD